MDNTPEEMPGKPSPIVFLRDRVAPVAGLVLAVGIMAGILVLYFRNPDILDELSAYGYLGAFVISIIFNGTVLFPVGNVAVIASLGATLPLPLLVGVAGGGGAAIGELTGYVLGRSGRGLLARNAMYGRLEVWVKRYGWLAVFFLSLFPLVFDVVGIIAGALKMPWWRFMLACFAGRSVFYAMVAYLGAIWFKDIPWWAFLASLLAMIAVVWLVTKWWNRRLEGPGG